MYRNAIRSCYVALAMLVLAGAAHAQLFRAYVSSTGTDTNPCTLPEPCRLLPAALNAVASGGEIWMLDSANFNTGTVNITKSVSILAVPGAVGSVVAIAGGPAITLSAASIKVALRNIVFTSVVTSPGTRGIEVTANNFILAVEDCLFANLPSDGIKAAGVPGSIAVKGSVFRNIGTGSVYAIWAQDGPVVTVANSHFEYPARALLAYGHTASTQTIVSVTDSTILGAAYAVAATADVSGATAKAFVTRSTIHHGLYGLSSNASNGGSAFLTVSNSTVANNTYGYSQTGTGVLKSMHNNYIDDNGLDNGTLTDSAVR